MIPKALLRSFLTASDAADWTLGSKESSARVFARLLLARSKVMPLRAALRKLNRVNSDLSFLSGRTLNPSLSEPFADWWTSTLRVSLVSRSVARGLERPTMIQGTFGRGFAEELSAWHRHRSSSKTSRPSSASGSKEMAGPTLLEPQFCSMSSANWNDWATALRRESTARRKLARLTFASGSSSTENWPTATQRDYKAHGAPDRKTLGDHAQPLTEAVANWTTPTVRDHHGESEAAAAKRDSPMLVSEVRKWNTPTVNGNHNVAGMSPQSGDGLETQAKNWGTPRVTTNSGIGSAENPEESRLEDQVQRYSRGQWVKDTLNMRGSRPALSAQWISILMGFPPDWTALTGSGCLETPSCPKSLNLLSEASKKSSENSH